MSNLKVEPLRAEDDELDFLALVRVSDGRQFNLGIQKSVIDVWQEQLGEVDVDAVASKLAKDILD
jgi:hypothetical protein